MWAGLTWLYVPTSVWKGLNEIKLVLLSERPAAKSTVLGWAKPHCVSLSVTVLQKQGSKLTIAFTVVISAKNSNISTDCEQQNIQLTKQQNKEEQEEGEQEALLFQPAASKATSTLLSSQCVWKTAETEGDWNVRWEIEWRVEDVDLKNYIYKKRDDRNSCMECMRMKKNPRRTQVMFTRA